jgi:hypothetical protein
MSLQKEQELIDKYISMSVDGIILYPVDNEIYNPTILQLSMVKFPLILLLLLQTMNPLVEVLAVLPQVNGAEDEADQMVAMVQEKDLEPVRALLLMVLENLNILYTQAEEEADLGMDLLVQVVPEAEQMVVILAQDLLLQPTLCLFLLSESYNTARQDNLQPQEPQ